MSAVRSHLRRPRSGGLAARWAAAGETGQGLRARTRDLLAALDAPSTAPVEALPAALDRALAGMGTAEAWLALATLSGVMPTPPAVSALVRAARLDGPSAALDALCLRAMLSDGPPRTATGAVPRVRVLVGAIIVDVSHTSRSLFATGIQRVARETVRRWDRSHDLVLVAWDATLPALRVLGDEERRCALFGADVAPSEVPINEVVVPWRCVHLLPELLADADRVSAFQAYVRSGGNRVCVVGFDCVPLTTAETTQAPAMSEGFAASLAAVAHADCVAPISEASGREYVGWRGMLVGAGLVGPRVRVVGLPAEAVGVSAGVVERVAASSVVGGLPLVLVVGSHEPRKNHLVVLHAAELLWREGLRFSVSFVGGNAWGSGLFRARLAQLAAAGRPVESVSAAPDEELWALYRLARFTVFPSLNEGFGLPVAESLSVGTPVVTSGFGSMAEIAAGGGALLVDPRDAGSVAGGMRRLLTDDALVGVLAEQARARPVRTWDDYAAELWDVLVESRP